MAIVSPGLTTVIIATRTFCEEPLVEKSVRSAPTAWANSCIAVGSTCQDWCRLSTPLFIPTSARYASSPSQWAPSAGTVPVPARWAGIPKATSPRS